MQSGAVQRFVGLLSHENVDIVIDVVEVVHELTDEDVGDEADEEDDDDEGGREQALKLLIDALVRTYHDILLLSCPCLSGCSLKIRY